MFIIASVLMPYIFTRAKANENDCGGTNFHRERIAKELESYEPDFLAMK